MSKTPRKIRTEVFRETNLSRSLPAFLAELQELMKNPDAVYEIDASIENDYGSEYPVTIVTEIRDETSAERKARTEQEKEEKAQTLRNKEIAYAKLKKELGR